jgi:uncharacterized protein (DUF697 family)
MVREKIIPIYAALAAGVGAIPIPFSDALVLVPLQVKMSMHILNAFGVNSLTGVESRFLESFIVSQVGRLVAKTLSANLIKLIPVIGSWVGGLVNATVASGFTWGIGKSVCDLCYRYAHATVVDGKKLSIAEAFSSRELLDSFFEGKS